MKISKRQLKKIIREEYSKLNENLSIEDGHAMDHIVSCYVDGMSDEECADSMPNANAAALTDFANFVMRVVNTYKSYGEF